MLQHVLPIRVYYEDTDAGGIVYHSNYLKFFERGRVEALRSSKIELSKLLSEYDAQFVVQSLKITFLQPALLDQLLYVVTEVTELGGASIGYHQEARLAAADGTLLCKATVRLACVNKQNRPRRLPQSLIKEMKGWHPNNR